VNDKAKIGACTEMVNAEQAYNLLQERYERDLMFYGKVTEESIALRKEVDRRIERLYR